MWCMGYANQPIVVPNLMKWSKFIDSYMSEEDRKAYGYCMHQAD